MVRNQAGARFHVVSGNREEEYDTESKRRGWKDPGREFLGGALAPGIEISIEALAARAAQLRKVELVRPRSVIGKNTVEALQSGAVYGFAGQVDGLVRRIVAEVGPVTAVIATGGLAPIVVAESETITAHEPDLTLIGLRLVYERNV